MSALTDAQFSAWLRGYNVGEAPNVYHVNDLAEAYAAGAIASALAGASAPPVSQPMLQGHTYHDGLEGYSPDQVLVDGCPECEHRGQHLDLALAHMDIPTFRHAWQRATILRQHGLPGASHAEVDLLRLMGAIQVHLQRVVGGSDLPASDA